MEDLYYFFQLICCSKEELSIIHVVALSAVTAIVLV